MIRDWLKSATSIAALTGAGISAESGLPTFRGPGGLWRQRRPEELARREAFAKDPKLIWEWYNWRRSVIAEAQPNPAHVALAKLEEQSPGFTLITQNVDGLHDRAGSRNIKKVHGDIWTVRCVDCGRERREPRASLDELPPRCECGGIERPGVVWFGESLPQDVWQEAEQAARAAQVMIVIGTSAVVYPAAGLVQIAQRAGAKIIEINIEETPISGSVDACLRGPASEIVPELVA
jgi:NAD-dependent deacetylase